MNRLVKTWDNRKERRQKGRYAGWDRRVRWYLNPVTNIVKLVFEDEVGEQRWHYDDRDEAQNDWEAFKTGTLTVTHIMGRAPQ